MQARNLDTETIHIRSQKQKMWQTIVRNKTAVVGFVMLVLIAGVAILADDSFIALFQDRDAAPLIAPENPYAQNTVNRLKPPNDLHWLGTDEYGRDVLSRIVYGTRVSLIVGLCAALLGAVLGTLMGIVAGYAGGTTENIIMRLVDVLMAFPSLLMGLMLMAALHGFSISGMVKAIVAIGITSAPGFARLAHSSTLTTKQRVFVDAAHSIGASNSRILRLHIFPNIMGEVIVLMSLQTAQAIRVEASLSFIGLGVAPPTPTWGNMIREGMNHITYAPYLSVYPGLAILLTVLAFNLVGDGLRDILDPRLRE